ncbi:hypothetical protein F4678DRAFT_455703 [Xylaria arbuscula]|nr:hypothetical protein F4678DRAFT_455703 [Xylaria arbuscula]
MSETYYLDPQGDVLLTLRIPDAPFAIWLANEAVDASTALSLLPAEDKLVAKITTQRRLVVFMSMTHGHNHRMPKLMDLENLVKIALVINCYQCYDIVEPFGYIWQSAAQANAKALVQGEVARDFVLVLLVSWAFRWGRIFALATKAAIERC